MINAKDLRIGNWVIGSHSETPFKTEHHQVTGFDLYGNRNDYFQPIELTPELLEKCGFKKYDGTIEAWNNSTNETEFDILRNRGGLFYACKAGFDGIDHIYGQPIKYLHQLQNLFYSLTGKEIEVNL